MTNEGVITVKIHKNNIILKCLNETVQLKNHNWGDYMKSLRTIQKNVNIALTELVEQEKTGDEQMDIGDEDYDEHMDEDEEDDEDPEATKRKLRSGEATTPKKAKV
ncbi:uncharacterized protein LOC123010897 [Tribolium madens]|uniref:uncharacterized protein LOC123010897 n=1 Tax=Tribolium madens TaxID=41895 RepID=UPI001CF7651A|nr:uncharacterized protein LOC123010897 [Tribolium madens]